MSVLGVLEISFSPTGAYVMLDICPIIKANTKGLGNSLGVK